MRLCEFELISKIGKNTKMDCSLKFGCMNKKLLVIVNHHVTVNLPWIGTNHSSHAEKSMRNKFAFLMISKKNKQVLYSIIKNLRMRGSN